MTPTEREMIQPLIPINPTQPTEERFTSLQPTYEDTVPPESDDAWDDHD